jgi:hypothetical protein
MIWRLFPWLLVCLSFLGNLYLFVLLLDAGALIDGARSSVERLRERSDLALFIVRQEWVGKEVAGVRALSDEIGRQGVIVKNLPDGSFEVGDLIFETKEGIVTQVRYFD